MVETIKQVSEAVVTHPKTGIAVIATVKANNWWADWGSEIIDQLTSIAGLILVIVLIFYHLYKTIKIKREGEEISSKIRNESAKNNHELKEQLRKEIAEEDLAGKANAKR